ncbi:MAG: InlB B-repeat-containing protein, partial [Muribaculaceae bacterium]|nr:InlB B-repeat-containing protein [Muribaculaceae bacterium]
MKKTISNKLMTLIVLILSVFSSAKVNAANEWTVNPANYRYDMSLYFEAQFAKDKTFVDLSKYEVGAFVGEECRGIAENISGADKCLYLRVRSNSESGEEISFKIKEKNSGEITVVEGVSIPFQANEAVGLPSSPYLISIVKYFDLNVSASQGGSVSIESGRYPEGETVEISAIPDDHYSFEKWNDGVTEPTRSITMSENISLEATFKINSHILTYVIDDVVINSYSVEYGKEITPLEAPEKEGYTFSGWKDLPETMPDNDVTVSGSYTINSYKLSYILDGQEYKSVNVNFGEKITPEEAPVKEGYTFSGWEGIPETMPAKDVTVSGSFAVNAYKLTYMVDGQEYKSVNVNFGEKITPEEAPVKEGYTFSGWEGIPETMPAKDVTVSGSFAVNAYKLTYMVDGQEYKSVNVNFGEKITPEEAPVKEGYTFSGWEGIPETMPAKDVTVSGSFAVNAYKLTYIVDGQEYKSVNVNFGEKITPEEAPVKEGYTFSGWEGIPETMPAKDVTVSGSFAVNAYKLTYTV